MADTYDLGQIIYVLSNKSQTVVPAVVSEEFVHKKLNGNLVTYKVAIGPVGKQKIVDLEKIDGEVFTSLDSLRSTMVDRLTTFVNELVSGTEERVKQWYGNPNSPNTVTDTKSSGDKVDPSTLLEQANSAAAAPVVASSQANKHRAMPTQENGIRAHLRSMLDPGYEEGSSSTPAIAGGVAEEEQILPDGTRVKTRIHV